MNLVQYSIIGIAFFLPLSSGIVNTLIGAGIVFWIGNKVAKKEIKIKSTRLNIPLLLFFVISCISILNSVQPFTSLRGLVKVLKYLGIYFMVVESIDDIRLVKNVIIALILGAVIACLDGVFQYITGEDLIRSNPLIINAGVKRMTAVFRHCNDFGVYLVTVAGVIWTLALYEFKKKAKWLGLAAAVLVTLCIALTFSRGAALGFFGAMLLMGIVKRDKLILAVLLLSLIATPFLMPSGVKEWSSQTKSFLHFFCNLDRIAYFKTAIEMIKAHPVIGVGINTFMLAYSRYKVPDVDVITGDTHYAHNNYLHMASEIGLIGLGIFLWVLIALFLELRRIYGDRHLAGGKPVDGVSPHFNGVSPHSGVSPDYVKNAAVGLGCGVLAFLLNGLTESSFYFSKIVVIFWFVAGLGVGLKFVKE